MTGNIPRPYDWDMKKNDQEPRWVDNLRTLMSARDHNPRSLSLKAGLNPTAVRDMLEGRVKFPRYDTVEALAKTLEVTPAQLMGAKIKAADIASGILTPETDPLANDELNLMTEIITRLQEAAQDHKNAIEPKAFAAMVTSLYRQMQAAAPSLKSPGTTLAYKIHHLMEYETLRRRTGGF